MDNYKCPRCEKELTKEELDNKICFDCGCLFSYSEKTKKTKKYSSVLTDSRKMNYRLMIKVLILFLFLWSGITVASIIMLMARTSYPLNVIISIVLVFLYILVFVVIQFLINVCRDTYVLKLKEKTHKK